jgi:hypothetical protein
MQSHICSHSTFLKSRSFNDRYLLSSDEAQRYFVIAVVIAARIEDESSSLAVMASFALSDLVDNPGYACRKIH